MLAVLRKTRGRDSAIGLDIGRACARAVQLRHTADRYELIRAARIELDGPADRKPADSVRAEPLRRVLRQHGFSGRTVIAGVGVPDAELHALDLPAQVSQGTLGQRAQAARVEMCRLMSCEPAKVETAYWTVPSSPRGHATAIGVAAPTEWVWSVWELCHSAGLDCRQVDAHACACARFGYLVRGGKDSDRDAIWGMLDLGLRGARLILCLEAVPVVVRFFPAGGGRWTQLIAGWLDISEAAAEVHKCDHGLAVRGRSRRADDAGSSEILGDMILNVLRRELDDLASQIERSYAYALQCYAHCSASELMLWGGGAELKCVDTFFGDRLGITVRRVTDVVDQAKNGRVVDARSTARVRIPLTELACAVGLALPPDSGDG
jgi:Tfp pilus assembly PilM family ATPase